MSAVESRHIECPTSILVLQLCPIGDTMFGTPALRALRQRFRDAHISVLTWQSSCEVLKGNPNIDCLIPCVGTLDMARTVSKLKSADIDLVVGLSHVGSWLSAAFPGVFKVGFNSTRLGWLYAEQVPDSRTIHAIDYCLQVVRSVGAVADSRRLEFYISDKDRDVAANWASAEGVTWRRTVVTIHPGGKNFTAKRWRTSGFAAVADRLVKELGAEVIIVGGPDDVPLAQSIADQARSRVFIAAGRLSLKQTGALIERSALFIGNDSAPQHIASALDTPVVALFGPTDPDNFGPSSSLSTVVTAGLPCSPCFHWMASPLQYLYLSSVKRLECRHECMSEISPDQVMSAAHQLLDRARQRSAARTERKLTVVRRE
ncbi:MAG: glycosyltransferase family 9 protein [Firmicutes bacterium]|nr:glycosyltransferase family 9 protein [Bacillota bacterium]